MSYQVFYGGYNPGNQSDREQWPSCAPDWQVRTEIKRTSANIRRRRRYWCVNPTSTKIGWKGDGTGGQACVGLGNVSAIGGGEYGFPSRDKHFPGSFAGYKCSISTSVEAPKLKTWSSDSKMTTAGAKDNNGKFKSLWDQIAFGIATQHGTSIGFCANANNLSKVVHNDGRTCYEMLKGAGQQALADTKTALYCVTPAGRMDEKCKCYNVSDSRFLSRCKANPTWPGCKEIIPRINELQTLLKDSNLTEADFGNADCIVPDICGGAGIYIPSGGKPNCAKKMEVCNQVMNQENVKAYGDLKAIQSCNFTGENSLDNVQKKRDEAAAAAAALAAAAHTPSPAPTPAGSLDPTPAGSLDPTPSGSLDPTPSGSPAAADGVAVEQEIIDKGMGQNTKIAIGVGGGVVVLCCCLLLVMMMMMGGGGRRRR